MNYQETSLRSLVSSHCLKVFRLHNPIKTMGQSLTGITMERGWSVPRSEPTHRGVVSSTELNCAPWNKVLSMVSSFLIRVIHHHYYHRSWICREWVRHGRKDDPRKGIMEFFILVNDSLWIPLFETLESFLLPSPLVRCFTSTSGIQGPETPWEVHSSGSDGTTSPSVLQSDGDPDYRVFSSPSFTYRHLVEDSKCKYHTFLNDLPLLFSLSSRLPQVLSKFGEGVYRDHGKSVIEKSNIDGEDYFRSI